jgi:hypothetical protein
MKKTIYDLNEKFNKDIDIIKRKQTENSYLNNSINEIKNTMESFKTRVDHKKNF